jgi:outer membrane lipoprotein-sorting protein
MFNFTTMGRSEANSHKNNAEISDCVKKIEDFFNRVKTLRAEFKQIDKYGKETKGYFLLKRPGLMKMECIDPPTSVMIAKKNKIIYFDKELKEKTITSSYSSPLSFFLDSVIRLHEKLNVVNSDIDGNIVSITFCRKNAGEDGAIIITFMKTPFLLLGWEIFSKKIYVGTNNSIKIILSNQKLDLSIDNKEFSTLD